RPYRPDYLTKRFKTLVRADERLDDSLTLHSLRASCVSILIHEGVDIKDVQAWVGHRDVQTTLNIYARTNEARKEKTADLLSTAMFLENS
ncbi:MAG: tyrosine-type recombinase/integrase, partial [Lachnospiraceae bacterium]|nr:tyrosine-type recombinase/integrase [Lachnospiraceae bacterium]